MSDIIQPRTSARRSATQRDVDIKNYWRQVAAASLREKRPAEWHIREAQAAKRRDNTKVQRLGR